MELVSGRLVWNRLKSAALQVNGDIQVTWG
jgi:hypothetical protein